MPRFAAWFLLIILLFSTATGAVAAPSSPAGNGPSDPAELEAFLDPIFAKHMKDHGIPGAVIALVKDGRILFTKGYGLANVETGAPVVPDRSLFAIGSVTKLFTATALMQLAEQGKLDLHADVNQYLLEFQLPTTYSEPVTTAHLMTHTGGFDEVVLGIAARSQAEVEPLSQFLARTMPRRIRPPGQESQYSNWGVGLAGHLVEVLSGRSYNQYIADEILKPLGMTRSTMEMPAELAADIVPVNGYLGTPPVRQPDWILNLAPAGDMKATATDMAAFMIAHLQNGEYQGKRILQEQTARLMHQTQFSHHPNMPGIAYQFMERLRNGHRAIEHGGDTLGTSSLLTLLPEQNWGFFVSYNAPAGGLAREELANALLDRYAPGPVAIPTLSEARKADAARYAGTYRLNRSPKDTFGKLQGLVSTLAIADNGDGSLTLKYPMNLQPPVRLIPVEPLLLRSEDGQTPVAFKEDGEGRITRMFIPMAVLAGERLAWYESPMLHVGLLIAMLLLALSALLAWPVGALIRRRRDRAPLPAPVRRARWLGGVVSGLHLSFVLGLGTFMATAVRTAVFGAPPWVKLVLAAALLGAVTTVPLVWAAVRACRTPGWSMGGKIHLAMLTAAAVLFLPFLYYWNLWDLSF